jgi:hypothetical protein
MRAFKFKIHVAQDRTLCLKLPEDVQEGPAEVIVLIPEGNEHPSHKEIRPGPTGRQNPAQG